MGLKKMKKYQIIEVKWRDAAIYTEPKEIDKEGNIDVPKCIERTTIGYFIKQDKHQIALAATIDETAVAEINVIPNDWILNITIIKK